MSGFIVLLLYAANHKYRIMWPWPLITKKTPSYRYNDSHYKFETVSRPSEVWNGDAYTRKTPFFSINRGPGLNQQKSWWRHQMEAFSGLLSICAGNSPVTGEFPIQRPVTRSFDVFGHLRVNKHLSKQSWGWWFETLSRPLLRHCNVISHRMSPVRFPKLLMLISRRGHKLYS